MTNTDFIVEKKDFVIEKNVPIPQKKSDWLTPKFPFRKLEVGDSFVVSGGKEYRSLVASITHFKKNNKVLFKTKRISDTEYRCWRIA